MTLKVLLRPVVMFALSVWGGEGGQGATWELDNAARAAPRAASASPTKGITFVSLNDHN